MRFRIFCKSCTITKDDRVGWLEGTFWGNLLSAFLQFSPDLFVFDSSHVNQSIQCWPLMRKLYQNPANLCKKNISYVKFKLPSLFMDHKRNSKIVLQLKCILVWADLSLWTFWICKEILAKLKVLPHFCSKSIMLESLFRNKQARKLGRYYLQNLKTLSTHWLTEVGARRFHRI